MMPDSAEQTLAKLAKAQADTKDTIREMHEMIQAGRAFLKELRAAMTEAKGLVPTIIEAEIDAAVKAGLEELGVTTRKAMDVAVEKVMQEFMTLTEGMLGKKGTDRDLRPAVSAYYADTMVRATTCPSCGEDLSAASNVNGGDDIAQPGDFSVCAYCATILRFGADMGLHSLTPLDEATMPSELRKRLVEAAFVIQAHNDLRAANLSGPAVHDASPGSSG